MSKNKRQHFVPQHYLRQFTRNHKIGVALTEPYRYIGPNKPESQCKANYFYRQGDDDSTDNWLQHVENETAGLLKKVSTDRSMSDEELVAMRMIAVIFYLRTRKTAEIAKLPFKRDADMVIKGAIDRGDLPAPPGGWRPGLMDISGMSGALLKDQLVPCWMEMHTLEQKFLTPKNKSKQFITSDHPVVLLNQLLDKGDGKRSFSGFSRSGFQMVFPLSPESCLFFYDPKVYKVGNRRDRLGRVLEPRNYLIQSRMHATSSIPSNEVFDFS